MNQKRTVLVTGGAGYIGSHAALALLDAGYAVVVLDTLATGHRRAVEALAVTFIQGDVGDARLLDRIFAEHGITAVLHFAASTVVPESVARPLDYYHNNAFGSLVLIERAVAHQVEAFVFSSTAAVYGNPDTMPVAETCRPMPISPYGRSKLMTEQMLADAGAAHGLRHIILRYFNVAGADPEGRLGQMTPEATHLIKVACEVAVAKRPSIKVYGDDYPTPDGTCLRDFIHVTDLAAAHVKALDHLLTGGSSTTLNCGYGHGVSVKEVLRAVERVSGRPLAIERAPRRPGDPVAVIADTAKLRAWLDWQPRFADLDQIIAHALAFEARLAPMESASTSAA